ncbi:MAG: cupin [Methylotenera sp.]|uniref:cupin domain-containing protein n=1 Tax=Methylotenera sp. TaxID=2051956 RepID=UPI000D4723B1|nr:cupin domain-containing protein [Methylotenera sp.]PPC80833.1 MAG: cupin [Methylotenera sp.]
MNNQNQPLPILGGMTANEFLKNYWHKKPLLIKNAIPSFNGLLTPEELAGLACEDEVQSRIVEEIKGKWHASHGPFNEDDFVNLPETPDPKHRWTLLVQSVNHHLHEASELLSRFNFIPHARLDDLMVSYAPDGGGVGPHFDSYDVFLLQGQGKRLWRISDQTDLTLVEGAPLRILKSFDTTQEWLVEAGDLLYLPPHLAHWGIAVSDGDVDCMTYSIGFRAPKVQELATEFLGYMQDTLNKEGNALPGIYQDADLTLQAHPAEISHSMITKVADILKRIQWSDQHVADFLGTYLSEPKPDIIFDPNKKISLQKFSERLIQNGICLDLKSQMLFTEHYFYLNGESITTSTESASLMKTLADYRKISAREIQACGGIDTSLISKLYEWYMAGYLYFDKT